MKFKIINSGDSSVGLQGFDLDITIGGAIDVLDEGFIERFKEFMLAELDGCDGRTEVLTSEEYDDLRSFDEYSTFIDDEQEEDNTSERDEREEQRESDLMAYYNER